MTDRKLTSDELRLGRLAVKKAEEKYRGLKCHVSDDVWQDLVLASMASVILGQVLEEKFGPAQRLLRAAIEAAAARYGRGE